MKTDPIISLAVDNCFASKRWTVPSEWMDVIKGVGLDCIEVSADTECDPLYMGGRYISDWIRDVQREQKRTGTVIKNLYSGHGTYATAGLAHTDPRVRRRFLQQWMETQADTAKALDAGFGFFAHGFDDSFLQDAGAYSAKLDELYDTLAELAAYCGSIGLCSVSLEQMYSPHQPPWTVDGTLEFIREVSRRSGGYPMYITNDVGHMNGQQFFQKPTEEYILGCIEKRRSGKPAKRVWLGTAKAIGIYRDAAEGKISDSEAVSRITEDVEKNPQLFAKPEDGDVYNWLEKIGPWASIVHLQQSDGKSSPHWCFDEDHNSIGIINGEKVIRSVAAGFQAAEAADMPSPCGEVVFTLEPFIGTAGNNYDALEELETSVRYWRKYIPADGMRLSEAVALLNN